MIQGARVGEAFRRALGNILAATRRVGKMHFVVGTLSPAARSAQRAAEIVD